MLSRLCYAECARYSLCGKNHCGYKMLHLAIWTGEAKGLIGVRKPVLSSNEFPEDMEVSLRRTAWGLFQIDTCVLLPALMCPELTL